MLLLPLVRPAAHLANAAYLARKRAEGKSRSEAYRCLKWRRRGPPRRRPGGLAMTATKNAKAAALEALTEAHAIELKLPTVRRSYRQLAEEALARS